MKIFIDLSKMSNRVTDHPLRIINNLICLLFETTDDEHRNGLFISGSKNKDGNTYLPLDPIMHHECHCNENHKYEILIEVERTFYAVSTVQSSI